MDYRNPKNTVNGLIDCEINHPRHGWIPFTCDPSDTEAEFDTKAMFDRMSPDAAEYTPPPPPSNDEVATMMRAQRNELLAATDFYALPDVTMSTDITTYRQALRDITNHANWPNLEEDDWPIKP